MKLLSWIRAFGVAAMLAGVMVTPVAAMVTMDQVKSAIASKFGVQVLKVEETQGPEGPAYLVTVMNPGGDSNSAFQVNTLMVDQQTGKLVSAFRHLPAGYDLSGSRSFNTKLGEGEELRRRSLEERH